MIKHLFYYVDYIEKGLYFALHTEGGVLDVISDTKSNFIDIIRHTQEVSKGVKLYHR